MGVADLRRVFSDVGHVRARLETAVNLRLQSELGLPLALFEGMTVVTKIEGCRVHDLADTLGMSGGSASKLADRLCALGYCRRLPNPDDRRSSLLKLTPAGQRKLAVAARSVDHELEGLVGAVLSAAQIRELAAMLHELRSRGLPPSAREPR
jgi:MarR family transcriptional regulator, organic hydroperoxide resistance regulator